MGMLVEMAYDANNQRVVIGDCVKFLNLSETHMMVGIVYIISDRKIGMKTGEFYADRFHYEVEKITEDEYVLLKLENE